MASRPNLQHFTRTVENHEEEFWELVSDAKTVKDIAKQVGVWAGRAKYPFGRRMVYHWIHQDKSGERWKKFKQHRAQAAHVLAEDALEILDEASPASISVDRERARTRQWLAERYNRAEFGDNSKQANVTLNVGQLFLDAMRAPRAADPARLPERERLLTSENPASDPAGDIVDAEVVEIEEVSVTAE